VKAKTIYRGMYQTAVAVKHALCSDGRRRRVRLTSEPDTYFSIPGSVCVHGKTVSGFIMQATDYDATDEAHANDTIFSAVLYGKNAALLPNIPAADYFAAERKLQEAQA
jgi:hypothetical protein